MLVITVALLKGGVGKSTVAVTLAELASHGGNVTVIDMDPMASAYRWSRLAAESGTPLRSTVVPRADKSLSKNLGAAALGADIVVIDAPPPGDLALGRAAIEAADYVVIPCTPELAALDRVPATVDIATDAGKRYRVLLTMVRRGLAEHQAALSTLTSWQTPVFQTVMPLAVSIQRCYGQQVSGTLARYGVAVLTEIFKEIADGQA
jgi:cellulose biosynthesis protein BcsQ